MSRPRKMTLGDALEALADLPRVLKALEVLNGEQEKVRALMGKTTVVSGRGHERREISLSERHGFEEPTEEQRARGNFGAGLDPALADAMRAGRNARETMGRYYVPIETAGSSPAARMEEARIILDTPERREYEEAKKAGKVVDDPFKNASEAQRERMAEQKALLALERARLRPALPPKEPATLHDEEAVLALQAAREELLDESANGSVGVEVET